ncbi:MAG: hypothetical protein JWP89_1739 [Schlesneria sp.]|nr:hypothetical protein [Schlesneria sp.]
MLIRQAIAITFTAAMLLTAFPSISAAATQADAAKLDIQAGDPAVDPNPPVVNESATVAFIVNLYSLDDQNVEQPAANVKSQSYTLTVPDTDGSIQQVTADGFTVTISSNSRTATITKNGGNSSPSVSIKAKVKYSSTGDKSVTLSGGATFNDNSALSASKTINFKVVDVRVDLSPTPIVTIMPFLDTTGATVQRPTRVTAKVAPVAAVSDISFYALPIPMAFPADQSRFGITEVSRDTSTGTILLDIIGELSTPFDQPNGDVKLQAKKAGVVVGESPVIVVIPAQFDAGGIPATNTTVDGQNKIANNTTSPSAANVIPPQAALITLYGVLLTIPIKDQFGKSINELYQGAAITESAATPTGQVPPKVPLNQALSAAGTYVDPSGYPVIKKVVNLDTDADEVSAWLNSDPPLPFAMSGAETVILRVSVGGFPIAKKLERTTSYSPDPPPSSTKAKLKIVHRVID